MAVLLVACGGVAVLLAMSLDIYLERNRDWLAARAEAAVGRKVRFEGIGVSFSGGLGVTIRQLEVADDPAFSSEPFLRADEVMVAVRLWPALFGRYEADRIALIGPDIQLIRSATGNNTDSLSATSGSRSPDAVTPAPSDAATPMAAIALADIRDGRIRLLDLRSAQPQELRIDQLDAEVSDLNLREAMSIVLSAAVLSSGSQNLRVTGRIGPLDADAPADTPFDLVLRLDGLGMQQFAGGPFADALPPALSFEGPVDIETALEGSLQALNVRATLDASSAAVRYDDLLDKPAGKALAVELEGKLYEDRFELASSMLRLERAKLVVRGRVGRGEPTVYDLVVTSDALPLGGWEALLPPTHELGLGGNATLELNLRGSSRREGRPTLDGTIVLDDAGVRLEDVPAVSKLNTTVTLAKGGARMPKSSLLLGGAPATLVAHVEDLARPLVVFELASPELTNRALGLEADAAVEVLRDVSIAGDVSNPKGGPRGRARLLSASGRISGLDYEMLEAELRYAASVLDVDRLELQTYQGKLAGSARYDMTRADDPRFELAATLRGLSVKQLGMSLFPNAGDALEGRLDSDIDLKGRSASPDLLRSTLTGSSNIEIFEGMLKDVNLAESALQAITGLPGLSNMISPSVRAQYPGIFSTGDTLFETLRGLFEVRDGQLRVNDMKLLAKDYGLMAGGSIGLDGNLKIRGTLTTSRELTESLIGASRTARYITGPSGRIEVPISLAGSLGSPSTQADTSELTRRAVENAAATALGELLNEKLGKKRKNESPKAASPEAQPGAGEKGADPSDRSAGELEKESPPPLQPSDPLEILIRRELEKQW